jgi:transaldolase/glucose-6-phosphate isomerase
MIQSPRWEFSAPLPQAVQATLNDWQAANKMARLWRGDPSLWTSDDEDKWIGWLGVVEEQLKQLPQLTAAAADAAKAGFTHALLLGMGGSSLCPEVLKITYGKQPGHPELHVLDSTDPAQIKSIEGQVDLALTLCIVASKSGSTLESNIFKQYFFDRMQQVVGKDKAGDHFIAITDPGSKMQQVAERDHFRKIFFGVGSIGGRYSALSNFGMVPAAVMGLDLDKFLQRTNEMIQACKPEVPAEQNPGVVLGAILGTLGNLGRNKVTIITSPGIHDLGAWLEQLIAESTGKDRQGADSVDCEALGAP